MHCWILIKMPYSTESPIKNEENSNVYMPHFDIIHNLYITAGETDEANFILEPEVDSDDEEDEDEQHKSMIQMQGDNTLRDNFKMLQKGEGKQKNNPPPKSAAALKAERRLV